MGYSLSLFKGHNKEIRMVNIFASINRMVFIFGIGYTTTN